MKLRRAKVERTGTMPLVDHLMELRKRLLISISAVFGCAVAWFTVTKALEFLLHIGGSSLTPLIDANKYLTLVMLMFAAFGVAFEFPLLLVFLMLVGVLNTQQLRRSRRWTAVGITVFA